MVERTMYQRKVDVDTLNAVKSMWADVSSVSPSSEQRLTVSVGTSYFLDLPRYNKNNNKIIIIK